MTRVFGSKPLAWERGSKLKESLIVFRTRQDSADFITNQTRYGLSGPTAGRFCKYSLNALTGQRRLSWSLIGTILGGSDFQSPKYDSILALKSENHLKITSPFRQVKPDIAPISPFLRPVLRKIRTNSLFWMILQLARSNGSKTSEMRNLSNPTRGHLGKASAPLRPGLSFS